MSSLRNNYHRQSSGRKKPFSRYCSSDGSPGGEGHMGVNGSITPVEFYVAPEPGEIMVVDHVAVVLSDNGVPAHNDYGNIPGPLPNGTVFFTVINGVYQQLVSVFNENDDFVSTSSSFDLIDFSNTVRMLVYRNLVSDYSEGVKLNGDNGDRFGVKIQDDLTTLLEHKCKIKGSLLPKSFN